MGSSQHTGHLGFLPASSALLGPAWPGRGRGSPRLAPSAHPGVRVIHPQMHDAAQARRRVGSLRQRPNNLDHRPTLLAAGRAPDVVGDLAARSTLVNRRRLARVLLVSYSSRRSGGLSWQEPRVALTAGKHISRAGVVDGTEVDG